MPQQATFSIDAKVDKGPDIKSEAKFEVGAYSAVLEEVIYKCCKGVVELQLPESKYIEMLVIAADKYAADADPSSGSNGMPVKCEPKYIKYSFIPPPAVPGCQPPPAWGDIALKSPHVFIGPTTAMIPSNAPGMYVTNDLPINVKVSVLVVRKKTTPVTQNGSAPAPADRAPAPAVCPIPVPAPA